jgi:triosephosphate isomerase
MGIERKTYIVANWKMNFTPGEASLFLHRLSEKIKISRDIQVILAPSTISLQTLSLQVNRRQFKLAAQNFYFRDFGAFTGEVSAQQLRGIADYALVGHSDRRYIFGEHDKDVRQKVAAALRNRMMPILCIGETADERDHGEADMVIRDQLIGGLSEVAKEDLDKVIVAYEPVWAISSNRGAKLAAPDDVKVAIGNIRKHIADVYGKQSADEMSVLYGGSVNSSIARAYLQIEGVDGLLIGGASLIADEFSGIVNIAKEVRDERL